MGDELLGCMLEPSLVTAVEARQIITESLSKMYEEGRFLGGWERETKNGVYVDTSEGDVTSFTREGVDRARGYEGV